MIKTCVQLCLLLLIFTTSTLFAADADIEKLSDDDWLLVKSKNFEIVTDLKEEKAHRLIEDLEAYRYFSIDMMGLTIFTNTKPLRILAIGSSSNFRKIGFPELWAGVFNLSPQGYSAIANVTEYSANSKAASFGRQVLFHEYNHFLMRLTENSKNYPMWYSEGMAEYWGTFRFDGKKIYIGDAQSISFRTMDMFNIVGGIQIDTKKIISTESLPYKSKKESDKTLISRFYAQSFFLTHYLHSTAELQQATDNYMLYLSYGYKQDDAFQKAYNMSYDELDKKLKKYLTFGMVKMVYTLKEGKNQVPDTGIKITSLNQAAFYASAIDILLNCGAIDPKVRKQALEKHIAFNPTDINAQALALIYGFAENPQQKFQELEKIAPQNPLLLTYKADGLRNGANMLRAGGVAVWMDNMKQARSAYRRAIKADPLLGLAYIGLGDVYNFMPDTEPLAEGAAGFDTASLFDRSASQFANFADMQIRMDKGLDALPAVRNAVAFSREKEHSLYAMILDNLEILNDVKTSPVQLSDNGLSYTSGTRYLGPLSNNKPQGAGKLIRPSGSYFEGSFVNGLMQGQGRLVTYGGFIYEGEFKNGIARGKGKIIYPADWKKTYEGDVHYTMPFGKGMETVENGKYEGDYWYTWKQGNGVFTSKDGKTNLKGRWIQGRYEWPEENGIVFVGYISETGKREGTGICRTHLGDKIEWCRFKDGVRQEKLTEDTPNDDKDD
jgi:tetratricopeptide (TPR) repeat protein